MPTNDNYIGIAMGIDVTDLKAGLSEANKQIQLANSEFKAASSGMDDWTKSTEGLNAKIKQLDTILTSQRSKLNGLQAEYEKVAASQGENSEAARRLQVQINNQTAVVNKTEREFNNYKTTLEEVEKGNIDLEKVSLRAGNAVEKTGTQAKEAGDGFTIAKGAIAGFIANGLTALVGAAKNAVTSILGLADATREYRQTLATLDTAATDVGVSTDFVRDKFSEMMGVFNDEGSVTEGLNNLLTAGFDEGSLDSITESLEGAALKWKDTLKFEGLADSLQEWIGSGGESLSGNFAELLERMGYNLDDVKAKTAGMTDEQRRNYAVNLLNEEGLNKVSQSYREQNKDMVAAQEANVNYQNAVANMGAIVEPITTKIREGFTRIVEKLIELTQNIDFEALGAAIDNAFSTFINEILPQLISGLQWILDNKDLIIAGIVGIGAAFIAWKVVSIIQSVVSALKTMTIAQYALNLAMSLNPIGLVVAAIAALVAAFVVLWNKSDAFRNFWIGLWDNLKKVVGVVVEWIKENWKTMLLFLVNPLAGIFKYCYDHFEGFRNFVNNIVESVKKFFTNLWNNLKNGASNAVQSVKNVFSGISSFFSNTFQNAWNGVKNAFSNVKSFFSDKVEDIKSAFTGIKDKFLSIGDDIVKGIWQGIKDGAGWLKDKITGFTDNVAGWFKDTFKIGSPSKLMADEVGLYVGEGVGEGVVDSLPYVKKDLTKFSNSVRDNLGGIKSGLVLDSTSGTLSGGNGSNSRVINAGLTVNYNGQLSRKELKKTEDNYYKTIKLRMQNEGLV